MICEFDYLSIYLLEQTGMGEGGRQNVSIYSKSKAYFIIFI